MALPMVLWTIALLAGITVLLAGILRGWVDEETLAGKQFRARQQALSGVAVAMNPQVLPGDPLLKRGGGVEGEGYAVEIKDESGLINPNYLLSRNPDRRDILKLLFSSWKLAPEEADAAADGLYDWQSQTPFKSLHGAKAQDYAAAGLAGFPPGAPFVSPEEMELVIGFNPVTRNRPDWGSYFTTKYYGPVNLLRAPKNVLTDLLQLTPSQADAWITLRNGKDGIEGTEDDLQPGNITNAMTLMGVSGAQQAILGNVCGVRGGVRRIESTGYCNGVEHKITVVYGNSATNGAQAPSSVLGWTE